MSLTNPCKLLIVVLLNALLYGCGSNVEVKSMTWEQRYASHIANSEWDSAYHMIEQGLMSSKITESYAKTLVHQNPQVLYSGYQGLIDEISILREITPQLNTNPLGFNTVVTNFKLRILIYSKLDDSNKYQELQEKALTISDRFEKLDGRIVSYGRIIDVQIINKSTRSNYAGSNIGSAVGSAVYVDRAFSGYNWDYSATSHLGAMFLGSIIGSMGNTAAKEQYNIFYYIKQNDGDVFSINKTTSNQVHLPMGVCVEMNNITLQIDLTNDKHCK